MSRVCRQAVVSLSAVMAAACVLAAAPGAQAANAGWTGAAVTPNWSNGANWYGGSAPGSSISTLRFGDLGGTCDNAVLGTGSTTDSCYSVLDDAGTVAVSQLLIDDDWPYAISPQDSSDHIQITAPSGQPGLIAGASGGGMETQSSTPFDDIAVPVTLMNSQTWEVNGGNSGVPGLEVDDIDGSSSALSLSLDGPFYTTSLATGALTVTGTQGFQTPLVVEPNPNNSGDQPQLPVSGLGMSDYGQVTIGAPDTQSGPIAVESSTRQGGQVLTIGAGSAPDGTLSVTGDVNLAPPYGSDAVDIYIDGAASTPPTPTPSVDYGQLTASGTVTLYSELNLILGTDTNGNCEDLVPGQVYTLLSAPTIAGEFDSANNGQPIPDGATVVLESTCDSAYDIPGTSSYSPTVTIHYNTSSSPETVTATVLSGGHDGDVTQFTGPSPAISGPGWVGEPLHANPGGWSEDPTGYQYSWFSCPGDGGICTSVGGDSSDYTPVKSDVGNTISVCVHAINSYGLSPKQYCSDSTGAVTMPPIPELTSGAVSASGTASLGSVMTAEPGSWSGLPTLSYQWQRCGTQGNSCANIAGATGSSYTLAGADVGQYLRLQVTAGNAGGSTTADSPTFGPVQGGAQPAAPAALPSVAQIQTALGSIGHATGKAAMKALLKKRTFGVAFDAPSAGALEVTWTTTVTTGRGKRKKRKQVTVAAGSGTAGAAGVIKLVIHMTRAGEALLKAHPSSLEITATKRFEPAGGSWVSVVQRFRL